MRAIILVGGFGTRLRSVLPNLPKPMAPIQQKPFLAHLLDYLETQGITDVIFSVHYLREKIQDYFQSNYNNINISYAIEPEPLGTGGAIAYAFSVAQEQFRLQTHTQPAQPALLPVRESESNAYFVLNGDTFLKLDYRAMLAQHQRSGTSITMALRCVPDGSRYGKVVEQDGTIVAFREKGVAGPGLINAGVYLIDPTLFAQFPQPAHFSLESDFLVPHLSELKPQAFIANDYFIDIGIPEDYERALVEMQLLSN